MLLKKNIVTSLNNMNNMNIRNRSWLNRLISKESKKDNNKDNKELKKSNVHDLTNGINVGIVGGGMIAVHTAMLLKQHRVVKSIRLVDPKDEIEGQVLDVNQIDTSPQIKYYKRKHLDEALQQTSIIALMDESESYAGDKEVRAQFKQTCNNVREMTEEIVQFSPPPLLVVFARPVTATLPMVSEIYKTARQKNSGRIIGSTAIESMRLEATTASLLDLDPTFLSIPLVGGGDSTSLVPLFSRAKPINEFTTEQKKIIMEKLQYADNKLASAGCKVPTLSFAAAAANFIVTLVAGLNGSNSVTACAFVRSSVLPACKFFTSELQFGPNGIQKNCGLPKISPTEISMIAQAIPYINEYTEMGITAAYDKTVEL